MLYATKVQLANAARLSMLEIRQLELALYTSNARNIAVKAVLLLGIGFSGLIYTKKDYFQLAGTEFQTVYAMINMLIVLYSLLCVVQFNLIALMGPGLALRGPDGAVHLAIEGMMIEYRVASRWFAQATISSIILLSVYAFSGGVYRPRYFKVGMLAIGVAFLFAVITRASSIAREFRAREIFMGSFYPDDRVQAPLYHSGFNAATPLPTPATPGASAGAKPQGQRRG
jgi:hypothetical protein